MITASDKAANVTISMPAYLGNTPLRTVSVAANQSQRIVFGSGTTTFAYSQMDTLENTILTAGITGVKHNRGIRITSTNPVFVYYALSTKGTKVLYALKGKRALGTSFYIPTEQQFTIDVSYSSLAYKQFHVVASEDNTKVNIKPTSAWYGGSGGTQQAANSTYSPTLNKGQTVAIRAYANNPAAPRLAGSTVTANKPVAVTVAEDLIILPTDGSHPIGGDAGGDQIVPSSNVGRQYVVVRGYTGPNQGDFVYIMATQASTSVDITPQGGTKSTQSIASAGGFIKYHLSTADAAFISATKPVYVWQQSGIDGEADCVLVPSMYSIAGRSFSFYKESTGLHRVFILTRSGNEGNFQVNGSSSVITASDFQNVTGLTGWKYLINRHFGMHPSCIHRQNSGIMNVMKLILSRASLSNTFLSNVVSISH
jgi:hypothetical protein